MGVSSLNVVSIVVGILLVRLFAVWFATFKRYAESSVSKDLDESEKDYDLFKRGVVSSTVITVLILYLIMIIVTFYTSS